MAAKPHPKADPQAVDPLEPAVEQRWIRLTGILLLLLSSALAFTNRFLLTTDAVAYLQIARHYADGNTGLMVSGYWGPMFSWLAAPCLALGLPPLAAGRTLMVLSALLFWSGAIHLLRACAVRGTQLLVASAVLALAAAVWSTEYISPDLLVAAWMQWGLALLLSPRWKTAPGVAALAGLCFGAAYLAKAVALPWGIATLLLFLLWNIWKAPLNPPTPNALRSLAKPWTITCSTMVLIALPWIVILSLHYGKPTFSTTARIAHAIVGPPNVERYHPFGRHFHQPDPGRITSWEDPSRQPYQTWSPFESREFLLHQLDLIHRNTITLVRLVWHQDSLLVASIASLLLLIRNLRRNQNPAHTATASFLLTPTLLLCGLYLPVYIQEVDGRYLYPLFPWLLATGLAGARLLPTSTTIGTSLVAVSLAITPIRDLPQSIEGRDTQATAVAHDLAGRLRAHQLSGPVAGSGMIYGNRTGLWIAFLLGTPWHGDQPGATIDNVLASQATLFVLQRNDPRIPSFLMSPKVRDLDPLLFKPEESSYPLKVIQLLPP